MQGEWHSDERKAQTAAQTLYHSLCAVGASSQHKYVAHKL